ncbi:cytosolic protein [Alcanivorax quisquiliarum]|uniref:Cytosolic protein n=1 Tax=Alcanivorax quisquiliarum TaxID=2933565 RepID=A0ABT0E641_9GAMM|nr:cytosolic protein [Alcanivorax quisquiliarum]MCK0537292.1 cytosolic protein [Alcanivorax quisquiliarum]
MDADEYDSPWKEAVEAMLPEFMAFYFPAAASEIDWAQPHRFLDQELKQIMPHAASGRRVVDKLAEVMLVDGDSQWIYLHIEIQSQRDSHFAERMYSYHYRIFDRYQRPVASFAILADPHPHWRPDHYQSSVLGCHQRLQFPIAKLLDHVGRERQLVGSDNPFAMVTLAHLYTRRTRHRSWSRYRAKRHLILLLTGLNWERARIIRLLRVVDWLMRLPPALDRQLHLDVATIRGEQAVKTYISSFERFALEDLKAEVRAKAIAEGWQHGREKGLEEGRERGLEQGLEQGLELGLEQGLEQGRVHGECAVLLRLLSKRFGPLPARLEERLKTARSEDLLRWTDRVLDAPTLDDVFG